MFNFAKNTIDMTAAEILNYYRNLYYAEPQVTERGIVANAINDYFNEAAPRAEVEKIFEEIEKIRAKEIHKCEVFREKEDDASERKYWEGGEHSLRQLSYWINELKKKYTEGKR